MALGAQRLAQASGHGQGATVPGSRRGDDLDRRKSTRPSPPGRDDRSRRRLHAGGFNALVFAKDGRHRRANRRPHGPRVSEVGCHLALASAQSFEDGDRVAGEPGPSGRTEVRPPPRGDVAEYGHDPRINDPFGSVPSLDQESYLPRRDRSVVVDVPAHRPPLTARRVDSPFDSQPRATRGRDRTAPQHGRYMCPSGSPSRVRTAVLLSLTTSLQDDVDSQLRCVETGCHALDRGGPCRCPVAQGHARRQCKGVASGLQLAVRGVPRVEPFRIEMSLLRCEPGGRGSALAVTPVHSTRSQLHVGCGGIPVASPP